MSVPAALTLAPNSPEGGRGGHIIIIIYNEEEEVTQLRVIYSMVVNRIGSGLVFV